jgi:hypothetical protein
MISINKTSLKLPPLYKYLKREYARKMMSNGEILIGTLSYYRDIEDKTRSDRNEGKKDSVTTFHEEALIKNAEDWENKLGFLKGSKINYIKGIVKIEKGTKFIGNEDLTDSYIYCTSKVYSQYLKTKFEADCCIEMCDVQSFLDAISKQLSRLELIYSNLPSGRNVEYIGHTINSELTISADWLKDEHYKDEEEFRFSFIPIIKKDGEIMEPVISYKNGIRLIQFHNANEIILNLKPQTIKCKEAIKYCRWK